MICPGDGGMEQGLQRGFLDTTKLIITALYPTEDLAARAAERLQGSEHAARVRTAVGKVQALPFDEGSFDLVAGVGPILLWGEREQGMREVYRVLRPGGAALIGGQFRNMPAWRRVSSDVLRQSAARSGVPSIRVVDDMGQWIEIRKGIDRERPPAQANASRTR